MPNRPALVVGDTVTWSSQSQGATLSKTGQVVAVFAAGSRPLPSEYPSLYTGAGPGYARNHESYVISVPAKTPKGKPLVYWPVVSKLKKANP